MHDRKMAKDQSKMLLRVLNNVMDVKGRILTMAEIEIENRWTPFLTANIGFFSIKIPMQEALVVITW